MREQGHGSGITPSNRLRLPRECPPPRQQGRCRLGPLQSPWDCGGQRPGRFRTPAATRPGRGRRVETIRMARRHPPRNQPDCRARRSSGLVHTHADGPDSAASDYQRRQEGHSVHFCTFAAERNGAFGIISVGRQWDAYHVGDVWSRGSRDAASFFEIDL
jgi:hypothetical protein